jgi:hypothetical protein
MKCSGHPIYVEIVEDVGHHAYSRRTDSESRDIRRLRLGSSARSS